MREDIQKRARTSNNLRYVIISISILISLVIPGCPKKIPETVGIKCVTTILPLAMIIREIVGDRGTVTSLLQPGSSPHTYEPKPSDVITVESSDCFFYVSQNLDGWATSFTNENMVGVLEMVPEELRRSFEEQPHQDEGGHDDDHHGLDPHFWTDPLTVKAVIPKLAEKLAEIDPSGKDVYMENSRRFSEELDNLNNEVAGMLEPFRGESVILMHPSFGYFLNRYGLSLAGSVELVPGSEPSPAYLAGLLQIINERNIKAIFNEPQLPRSAADMLSEETGLPIFTLDPNGGVEGRDNYRDLTLYNTNVFVTAFSGSH
ncbi:MAG: metal ABC transporter substrate-binding protein [bacterium]|nr:metal ABC transporter substrate-binding protein [bacterium]